MRRPRWSVRLRLTVLYGVLFLAAGALLLTITYVLVTHTPPLLRVEAPRPPELSLPGSGPPAPGAPTLSGDLAARLARQRADDLRQLLVASGVALAVMTLLAVGLGWLVAGRVLRPLRTMTVTTRRISEHNLDQRLAVDGPDDELKDLADTIDGVLGRLQAAFDALRRFVANASHELRTPLTFERTTLELAVTDPGATVQSLRAAGRRVLASNQQQERLIEALLTLARSQRGLERRQALDLAAITGNLLDTVQAATAADRPKVQADLHPAWTLGDPGLVERLVANLIDNARRHNLADAADGWVGVWTGTLDGRPTLRVTNSGPVIPADQVDALFQPFQRLGTTRSASGDGLGLGLSIVAAIATAHDADLTARPTPQGGLRIQVRFHLPRLPG